MNRMRSTEKSSILSTQIQMKEAKNTAGKAKLSSRCAMHRFASKRDWTQTNKMGHRTHDEYV